MWERNTHWWLVRATYVVDGRFFGHLFWKVEGSSVHTRESRTAINVQDGGGGGGIPNIAKLRNFGKFQTFIKVVRSINSNIGSYEWQPSSIIKDGGYLK